MDNQSRDKLKSLVGSVILGLEAMVVPLEQALGREDIPQDFQDTLADLCEVLRGLSQQACEARGELGE
jgi:hypothetical protein